MKICVIANSHAASLKFGWDRIGAEFPGVELAFFAARGRGLSKLIVKDGTLVAQDKALNAQLIFSSGGMADIVPHDHDAFVIYGLGLVLPRLQRGVSRALRRAAAVDCLQTSLAFTLLTRLRSITEKAIWLCPEPLWSSYPGSNDDPMLDYATLIGDLHAGLDDPAARVLGQPLDSVSAALSTDTRFQDGSLRLPTVGTQALSDGHRAGEVKHMNPDFGAFWLTENLPRILAKSG